MSNKESIIRIRISNVTKDAFFEACKKADPHIEPSIRLRMLIRSFIAEYMKRKVTMNTIIWRPEGYDHGAYLVTIELGEKEKNAIENKEIGFRIPRMKNRSVIIYDPDHRMAVATKGGAELRGKFKDGVWKGHLYTNGVPEDQNPTNLDYVKTKLEENVEEVISPFIDF